MAFFFWMAEDSTAYASQLWPQALQPDEILPGYNIPSDWKQYIDSSWYPIPMQGNGRLDNYQNFQGRDHRSPTTNQSDSYGQPPLQSWGGTDLPHHLQDGQNDGKGGHKYPPPSSSDRGGPPPNYHESGNSGSDSDWHQGPPPDRDQRHPPPSGYVTGGSGQRATQPPSNAMPPPSNSPVNRLMIMERNGEEGMLRIHAYECEGNILIMMARLKTVDAELARFRNACFIAFPFALVFSFALAWVVAGRAIQPIETVADTVDRVTVEGLNQRIDGKELDQEFKRLVEVFNKMMQRLESSFSSVYQFTGNAAHELKTPLAILQGRIDEALREEEPGSERQQFFADLLANVSHLRAIIDRLMLISKADAGRLELYPESVDLSTLVENMVEDAILMAPDLNFKSKIAPRITVECDRAFVTQILHNMLSNAIKYNKLNGMVWIELHKTKRQFAVRVMNTGHPISDAKRDLIFQRFYRGDESHSRRVEGVGLGLSLARDLARAHGGDLVLEESDHNQTVFMFTLPRPAPANGQFSDDRVSIEPIPRMLDEPE